MSPQFTDDDVGKDVLNAEGDEVGMIVDVEHGTAHVEPDPGLTDSIKATLGWGDTGEDTYPLQEEAVGRVTDDEIRLESDLSGVDTGPTGTETDTETSTDATTRTETGTAETETGAGTAGAGTESDRGIDRNEDDISGADDEGTVRRDDDDPLIADDTDDEGMMSDDDDDDRVGGSDTR